MPTFPSPVSDLYVDVSDRDTDVEITEPSLTRQEFAEECDVNVVVRAYASTGVWNHVTKREPRYGDFSAATSFSEALELVENMHDEFMSLPSSVRNAARNDPGTFLSMLSTQDGVLALADAGLEFEGDVTLPPRSDTEPAPKDGEGEVPPTGEGGAS